MDRHKQGLLRGLLCGVLYILSSSPAIAVTGADVTPGAACTVEDAVMVTANPSGSGGYVLTCESSVWVATLSASTPTANEQVATKGYVDTLTTAGGICGDAGPTDCPTIGDVCNDGTVYAGYHPKSGNALFLHPNNQSASAAWSSLAANTGADDKYDGEVNQAWIVANTTITDYPAFKACDDLNGASALGYTDWYLPAPVELYHLMVFLTELNAGASDDFAAAAYWTSLEVSPASHAMAVGMSGTVNAGTSTTGKSTTYNVRCIRKE